MYPILYGTEWVNAFGELCVEIENLSAEEVSALYDTIAAEVKIKAIARMTGESERMQFGCN